MPKLPRVNAKQIIKALKKAGFFIDHQTGGHVILYKDANYPPVTVPFHNKDLKVGTISSILKQAEISVKEFIELL